MPPTRIFVKGHRSMVGSALVRRLQAQGGAEVITRSRAELNLLDQAAVHAFLAETRPDYIFIAAAKVGRPGREHESPGRVMNTKVCVDDV